MISDVIHLGVHSINTSASALHSRVWSVFKCYICAGTYHEFRSTLQELCGIVWNKCW